MAGFCILSQTIQIPAYAYHTYEKTLSNDSQYSEHSLIDAFSLKIDFH